MMQVPTNYKMGSGLAATIMGQQAGLEAEQQGLANLYKAAETPTKMLEGAKAMDLLNNPEYMKATEQWQTTAAQGKVSEEQSKKSYNDLTLLVTQLQAYNGDIGKQQQILMDSFQKNGVPFDSPMAQMLLQKPLENTMIARDQVGQTLSKTPEHLGKMEERKLIEGEHWRRTQAEIAGRAQNAAVTAGATANYRDQAQLAGMLKDATNNVNNIQNNLAKIESAEGKNALINQFVASGIPQAEAEAAVNSPEFKQQLQNQLQQARAEQEHLKKQSPYFKGFNFGSPAPASTGSSSGLPPGVTLVK